MEEKNQLAPKKPSKGILIAALILLIAVLVFWLISRNSQKQPSFQNETNQGNNLPSNEEPAVVSPDSPADVVAGAGENAPEVIPGEESLPEEGTKQPAEAPIEKTSPITVKVAVGENGFSPSKIDVKAGQEVTLSITANNGVSIIVFSDGIAGATGIGAGQTKDIKFNAPVIRGEYTFRNDVPTKGFTGTINVK